MLPRGDVSASEEIHHLAVMLPSFLEDINFQEKNEQTDWKKLEARQGKSHIDAFDIQYEHGIAQQSGGSLDCGMYVCVFAKFLSDQEIIPHSYLDADLHRTRYTILL